MPLGRPHATALDNFPRLSEVKKNFNKPCPDEAEKRKRGDKRCLPYDFSTGKFNAQAFQSSMSSVSTWASTFSAMAGAGVTSGMGELNLGKKMSIGDEGAFSYTKVDGFNSGQIGSILSLNNFAGSLASTAVTYGMTGNATFNLARTYGVGLLEMSIGKDGFGMQLGMGGTDISYGTIASAMAGAQNWNVNNKITKAAAKNHISDAATALRAQWGFGDAAAKAQLGSILDGSTVLQRGDTALGAESAQTTLVDGKRMVTLNGYKADMTREEQLALGITMQHEAYRNGLDDGAMGQQLETVYAVYGHTTMTERMLNDKAYASDVGNVVARSATLAGDLEALRSGSLDTFVKRVVGTYDSEKDYWKLTKDGNLAYDGKASLVDENGNVIKSWKQMGLSSDNSIEGGLLNLLGISPADQEKVEAVRKMMVKSGIQHSIGKSSNDWMWNGNRESVVANIGGTYYTSMRDLTQTNMGKTINLGSVDTLFSQINVSGTQYNNFINGVYGSAIGFMNYTDTTNQGVANTMLSNVYTQKQMSMIRTNQTWFNNAVANGLPIASMITGNVKMSQAFGVDSGDLPVSVEDKPLAAFFREIHPGIDFGSGGETVRTPGGYWSFATQDRYMAYFQLYGGDLRMKVMHIDPKEIGKLNTGSTYGSGLSNSMLFNYPTEVFGTGTGPHVHIDFTMNLPYNGAYSRQFINPATMRPGSFYNYSLGYKDSALNYLQGYPSNFNRY